MQPTGAVGARSGERLVRYSFAMEAGGAGSWPDTAVAAAVAACGTHIVASSAKEQLLLQKQK